MLCVVAVCCVLFAVVVDKCCVFVIAFCFGLQVLMLYLLVCLCLLLIVACYLLVSGVCCGLLRVVVV